jgi:hypothetical protein
LTLFAWASARSRGALQNAAALQLRRHAKDGKDDFSKVGRGVEEGFGQRADTGFGALHVAGDKSVVSRDRRSTAGVITGRELLHQFSQAGTVGRGGGDFLAEHLFASGRIQLADLSGFVLCSGRDAGIAVNYALNVHQKFASKKPHSINGVPAM